MEGPRPVRGRARLPVHRRLPLQDARRRPLRAGAGRLRHTTEGNPILVHLDGVSAESTDACVAFLREILARGVAVPPVLVICDGAPGLCAAIDRVFPDARRQRCVIHRVRNVVAKVSEVDQDAVRADFWEIFDIPEHIESGQPAVAEASRRARVFTDTWGRHYPGAVDS